MISLGDFKTIYDAIKSLKDTAGDSSRNKFNYALKMALTRVANHHYGLSALDLIKFFNSNEVKEFIEINDDFSELDLTHLANILEKYINIEKESSAEDILKELLYEVKMDLLSDPQIKNIIISNDLEIIKRKLNYYRDDRIVFSALENYYQKKCATISDESWPYDIDESNFVKIFEISTGDLLDRNNRQYNIECLPYIKDLLSNGPVVCVGYYGMGKSTVSKMLFKNWIQFDRPEHPIFLTLSHTNLKDYCGKSLEEQIILEIKNTLRTGREKQEDINSFIRNEDELKIGVNRSLNDGRILLIFDGIDESICGPDVIVEFIRGLNSMNCSILLTCRLEFNPFFDAFNIIKKSYRNIYKNYTGVELLEWQKLQWAEYAKGLCVQSPSKKEVIMGFLERVYKGTYSNLPARPLFFKMLSDLEINNKTDIKMRPELDSNLAEIYYKFLQWKIMDDLTRKGCGFTDDLRLFKREAFKLIQDIAILEYRAILGLDEIGANIDKIRRICQNRKFIILSDLLAVKILLSSSLFSIIKRSDEDEFMFSHKSFMEYLVAYTLAESLLPEKGSLREPDCDENWELFQTNEVVQHFVNEIERIRITQTLTFEERDKMISHAFKKVIEQCGPGKMMEFDERTEGVLYYIGRLKIRSEDLVDFLHSLANNKELCNEKYHRTANLALSMIISPSYCENYVLDLLNDFDLCGTRFKLNKERSLKYYGEAVLKQVMKKDIDQYITKGCYSSIIPLKIFTYFATIPISESEIELERKYLQKVQESAKEHKHYRIQEICERINKILHII